MTLRISGEKLCSYRSGDSIELPDFDAFGTTWSILVFPGGNNGETRNCVDIFLRPDGPVNVRMSGMAGDVALRFVERNFVGDCREKYWGWRRALSHDNAQQDLAAHDDVLPLLFKLQHVGRAYSGLFVESNNGNNKVHAPTLAANMEALLASGRGADVTFVASGEEFAAHSQILCARSRVFAALLSRHSALAAPDLSAVHVPEEIEPSVFKMVLAHVYTDSVPDDRMTSEEVRTLRSVARPQRPRPSPRRALALHPPAD